MIPLAKVGNRPASLDRPALQCRVDPAYDRQRDANQPVADPDLRSVRTAYNVY